MSNKNENRVLSRLRGRELSPEEYGQVNGGIIKSGGCTFDPRTCTMDHDCEPPLGC